MDYDKEYDRDNAAFQMNGVNLMILFSRLYPNKIIHEFYRFAILLDAFYSRM
jgi:hypothetical protein